MPSFVADTPALRPAVAPEALQRHMEGATAARHQQQQIDNLATGALLAVICTALAVAVWKRSMIADSMIGFLAQCLRAGRAANRMAAILGARIRERAR